MIVIDVSYYQQYMTDSQWDLMAKVVDGFIIRLCFGLNKDTFAQRAINQCKRLGLPYAGYGWVDPTQPIVKQQDNFKQAIDLFKPASMFNDYEQYWTDWYAYMRMDLTEAYRTRFTPDALFNYYGKFDNHMHNNVGIPVGQYSADWFINQYCPKLRSLVEKDDYWEARYFSYYDKIYYTTKKLQWGVPYDIMRVKELAEYAGVPNGIGRQFSSYLEIYGLYSGIRYHLDWNVFTDEGFAKMFNKEIVVQPPVVPPPVVPALDIRRPTTAVWVREVPEGRIISYRFTSQTVVVDKEVVVGITPWAHILPNGWIGANYLKKI